MIDTRRPATQSTGCAERATPLGFQMTSRRIDRAAGWGYIGSMKVKTSITLSDKLLEAVDKRARQHKKTRSDFIEVAVRAFIEQLIRNEQNARDLEIINRRADFLNQEANDVLEYKAPL